MIVRETQSQAYVFIAFPDLSLAEFGGILSFPFETIAELLDLRLQSLHLFFEVHCGCRTGCLVVFLGSIAQPFQGKGFNIASRIGSDGTYFASLSSISVCKFRSSFNGVLASSNRVLSSLCKDDS